MTFFFIITKTDYHPLNKKETLRNAVAFDEKDNADMQIEEKVVNKKIGKVINGEALQEIILFASYKGDSPYAQNIRIEVRDLKGKVLCTIKPQTDYGYLPSIQLLNFNKNLDTKQIFLSMASGGSGGFGFFYVYDLSKGHIVTLFDYQKWDTTYTAEYKDNYLVDVASNQNGNVFIIDISLRDKEYLDTLYNENGKLKEKTMANVGQSINSVFPFYNFGSGVYELMVYQRITGLYNADSLGYMVNQMLLDNGLFEIYFESLESFGYPAKK